jgi:LDH2 family malate/lactate/ureidoglycolate dehydrogenase
MFIALDPEFFASAAIFEELVEKQIGYIHGADPLPGRTHPIYPGERGWAELDQRKVEGIDVPDEDWAVVLKALKASALDEAALTTGIA